MTQIHDSEAGSPGAMADARIARNGPAMAGVDAAFARPNGALPNTTLGERALEKLHALDRFTDVPGQIHRLFLSPAHKGAAAQVADWLREAGCDDISTDALGTVTGSYAGTNPDAKPILIGSHLDSVKNAGRYDGPLGVVAGIMVIDELRRRGERLPCPIEILAFGDEENVRFPTNLSSSRALAGDFDMGWLDGRDETGVTLREALERFGSDPDDIARIARSKGSARAYLEVHIEQGPLLESEGLAIGIVSSIASIMRGTVTISGEAGHAGTVPMRLRHDALAAAAFCMVEIERLAREAVQSVATVGVIDVAPKAANVIPAEASFVIDVRAPGDIARKALVAAIKARIEAICTERGLMLDWNPYFDASGVPCDPGIMETFETAAAVLGQPTRRLPSGAGHDAMAMARLCPVGMLFVRCDHGISHNPAEEMRVEDADVAIRVLLDTVRLLARGDDTVARPGATSSTPA